MSNVPIGTMVGTNSCEFAVSPMVRIDVNYPFDTPLLNRIRGINGIQTFLLTAPYTAILGISRLHTLDAVKKDIALIYRAYIKEFQVNRKLSDTPPGKRISSIVLPNGKTFEYDSNNHDETSVAEDIIKNLPGVRVKDDRPEQH